MNPRALQAKTKQQPGERMFTEILQHAAGSRTGINQLMATKGYFVITDISGYTEFLTKSELDHLQDEAWLTLLLHKKYEMA